MNATKVRLRARRALLWVCQRYDLASNELPHDYSVSAVDARLRYRTAPTDTDRALARLHWEAVWLEGAASPLVGLLRDAAPTSGRTAAVLVSEADSGVRYLPPDVLPLHVLPGVLGEAPIDAAYGGLKARKRDKIAEALAARLASFPGRTLVVVGAQEPADLKRLVEALEDAPVFDLDVVVWWEGSGTPDAPENGSISFSVEHGDSSSVPGRLEELGLPRATRRFESELRLADQTVPISPRDLAPVASRYRLITEADLVPPDAIDVDDLKDFFSGQLENWKGFAAELPIPRDYRAENNKTLETLLLEKAKQLRDEKQHRYCIVDIPSEGGAGATTLLRSAAFKLAQAGIPSLVLRPSATDIDVEDLLSFSSSLDNAARSRNIDNQPIAIFADAEHEHIAIPRFLPKTLAAHGRECLVVRVVAVSEAPQPGNERHLQLPPIRTLATPDEIGRCRSGFEHATTRWQLPLSVPSLDEWRGFANRTRWRNSDQNEDSMFWVALRYFLLEGWTGTGDGPSDALGQWIKRRTALHSNDPRLAGILDAIAALSSFRIVAPLTTVLRPHTGGAVGSSEVAMLRSLAEVVEWDGYSPSLEDQTVRFRHPSLAIEYLRQRGAETEQHRLAKLSATLRTLSPGRAGDMTIAELLATDIVPAWENRKGTDWSWRLLFFEALPSVVSNSSKPILHHWARCLYNQSKQDHLDLGQIRGMLSSAEELVVRATRLPRREGRDENMSHLHNTIGTIASRIASLLDSPAEANEAWGRARRAFAEAIRLGDGGNVEAFLAFAKRIVEHNERANNANVAEVAEALDLLDRAQNLTELGGEYDDPTTEELRVKALSFLDLGEHRLRALEDAGQEALAAYCRARLAEQKDSKYGREQALAILDAEESRRPLDGTILEYFLRLTERTEGRRSDFERQLGLYLRLESSRKVLDYFQAFRCAVLCYQTGRPELGARRFRVLRERSRAAGNTWPKLGDYLRDPLSPQKRQRLSMRVERISSDWRGVAYIAELKQSVPFRPRHFSPLPREGDVVTCEVKFEFSGPLAIP